MLACWSPSAWQIELYRVLFPGSQHPTFNARVLIIYLPERTTHTSRRRFPVRIPRPMSEADQTFDDLRAARQRPAPHEQRSRSWISEATWQLIDERVG